MTFSIRGLYISLQDNYIVSLTNFIISNYVVLVRKRTIPTELPPLVGEVSANFSG
jgi:predicted transcriptional regulator